MAWMTARGVLTAIILAVAASSFPFGANATEAQERELRIGVSYVTPTRKSTDFRVFTEEGFDQDIGREIARSLGLKPKFVRILPGDGRDLLAAGAVDVVVGRTSVEIQVAHAANSIETGFRSAKSVAMRTDTAIRNWDDLAGRIVCVSEAGFDEQKIAARYGAKLRVERAPALSLMRVRTGECDAAIHDAALLSKLFEETGWTKFSATLAPIEPSALIVEAKTSDPVLRERVEQAVRSLSNDEAWQARRARWARNVAFEVYLEQDAPDCH